MYVDKLRTKTLAQNFLINHQNCEYLEVGIGFGPQLDDVMFAVSTFIEHRRNLPEFSNQPVPTEKISCEFIDDYSGQSRIAFVFGNTKDCEDFRVHATWAGDLFLQQLGPKLARRKLPFASWVALMNSLRPLEECDKEPFKSNDCELQTFLVPNVLAIKALKNYLDESIQVPELESLVKPEPKSDEIPNKLGPEAPNRFHWEKIHVELEPKAWAVLNTLWSASDRTAEAFDLLEDIWGNDGTGRDRDSRLRGTQHVIRKSFEPYGIPYRIELRRGHVTLITLIDGKKPSERCAAEIS